MTNKEYTDIISTIIISDDLNQLLRINKTLVDSIKDLRSKKAVSMRFTLSEGDEVSFNGKHGLVNGKINRIKRKYALVHADDGQVWNVPIGMLEIK